MATSDGSLLHQQALTVSGLFTGLTLAALVLILNSPGAYKTSFGPISGAAYFQIVVTYVGLLGSVSSLAMLSYLEIAGGLAMKYSWLDSMGTALFLVSVFGFMGVIPLLLAPFTPPGAGIVLAAELAMVAIYFVLRRIPGPRPRLGDTRPPG